MRLSLGIAAVAATFAAASPAFAQVVEPDPVPVATNTADALVKGVVLLPLTISKVDDLDFGTVIASGVAGTVTIDADTGARTVSGGVTEVSTYPGGRAFFQGAGSASQAVKLTLTAPLELINQSDNTKKITVEEMVLDSSNVDERTTDTDGYYEVGVGGTFTIAANQTNGLYQASFELTADYF